MTVISSTILALKDPAMSKLKNSTDLAIEKYNNLIVCDNGEKKKVFTLDGGFLNLVG